MTDTDKINDAAQQVEVPVVIVTDTTGDVAKSAEGQVEKATFDAASTPVVADASLSAADGSTSSVAGG